PLLGCSCLLAPATPHTYPLSLHDALPISQTDFAKDLRQPLVRDGQGIGEGHRLGMGLRPDGLQRGGGLVGQTGVLLHPAVEQGADRKSTRLNSSHVKISYAVFCLKKKNRR